MLVFSFCWLVQTRRYLSGFACTLTASKQNKHTRVRIYACLLMLLYETDTQACYSVKDATKTAPNIMKLE